MAVRHPIALLTPLAAAIALSSARGAPKPNAPLAAGQAGPLSVAVPTLGDAPDLMLDGGLKTAGPWDSEAAEADPKGYLSNQAKTCGHRMLLHHMRPRDTPTHAAL